MRFFLVAAVRGGGGNRRVHQMDTNGKATFLRRLNNVRLVSVHTNSSIVYVQCRDSGGFDVATFFGVRIIRLWFIQHLLKRQDLTENGFAR